MKLCCVINPYLECECKVHYCTTCALKMIKERKACACGQLWCPDIYIINGQPTSLPPITMKQLKAALD